MAIGEAFDALLMLIPAPKRGAGGSEAPQPDNVNPISRIPLKTKGDTPFIKKATLFTAWLQKVRPCLPPSWQSLASSIT